MKNLDEIIVQASKVKEYHHLDANAAWQQFSEANNIESSNIDTLPSSNGNSKKVFIFILLIMVVALATYIFYPREIFRTIESIDSDQKIEMVDGSIINLNENSTVTYPINLDGLTERRVILKGEATFDISPNKDLPFIVEYDDLSIKVLGTIFKIENTTKGKTVENLEGSVKVFETGNEDNSMILMPGDKILYDGSSFSDANYVDPSVMVTLYDIYSTLYDRSNGKIFLAGISPIDAEDSIKIDMNKTVDEIFLDLENKANFKYNKMSNGEIAILELTKK